MNFTPQFDNLTSIHRVTIIMFKMLPVEDVAEIKGSEKAERREMTCEGSPHTCKHAHTNGNISHGYKCNREKSARIQKDRENK